MLLHAFTCSKTFIHTQRCCHLVIWRIVFMCIYAFFLLIQVINEQKLGIRFYWEDVFGRLQNFKVTGEDLFMCWSEKIPSLRVSRLGGHKKPVAGQWKREEWDGHTLPAKTGRVWGLEEVGLCAFCVDLSLSIRFQQSGWSFGAMINNSWVPAYL